MELTIGLVTTEQQMIQEIMSQFKVYVDDALRNSVDQIRKVLEDRIGILITTSPVVPALNTDLGKELGVTPEVVNTVIEEIISVVSSNMEISYTPVSVVNGRIVAGGYTIKILRSDFNDVLSIQDTSYATTNGVIIPWLNWLLYSGDSAVIYGYRIEFDPHNKASSRTGAVMVKDPGGRWGVPTQYAGTQKDNFLTRALIPLEDEIEDIVKRELGL
jgi:hypothetical protein